MAPWGSTRRVSTIPLDLRRYIYDTIGLDYSLSRECHWLQAVGKASRLIVKTEQAKIAGGGTISNTYAEKSRDPTAPTKLFTACFS
jgi:hypothetical protein